MTNTNLSTNFAAPATRRPGSATPAEITARIDRIEACIARLEARGLSPSEALATANRTDGAAV